MKKYGVNGMIFNSENFFVRLYYRVYILFYICNERRWSEISDANSIKGASGVAIIQILLVGSANYMCDILFNKVFFTPKSLFIYVLIATLFVFNSYILVCRDFGGEYVKRYKTMNLEIKKRFNVVSLLYVLFVLLFAFLLRYIDRIYR